MRAIKPIALRPKIEVVCKEFDRRCSGVLTGVLGRRRVRGRNCKVRVLNVLAMNVADFRRPTITIPDSTCCLIFRPRTFENAKDLRA